MQQVVKDAVRPDRPVPVHSTEQRSWFSSTENPEGYFPLFGASPPVKCLSLDTDSTVRSEALGVPQRRQIAAAA